MIATLILSLHLLGFIAAAEAATFLFICGALLILAEITFMVMGAFAFNGLLAIYVAWALHNGHPEILGVPIDWSLLFGIAFVEVMLVALSALFFIRLRRLKVSTGVESMVGTQGVVVDWDGRQGSVRVQGEIWKARAETNLTLAKDEKVKIAAVDGLTLMITH